MKTVDLTTGLLPKVTQSKVYVLVKLKNTILRSLSSKVTNYATFINLYKGFEESINVYKTKILVGHAPFCVHQYKNYKIKPACMKKYTE